MLSQFIFENFKCYRDETILDMKPAQLDEHTDSLIVGAGDKRFLPVSVIYGPNGGGKSTVLQAFEYLCRTVVWPYFLMRLKGGRLQSSTCAPYAFDPISKDSPTTFSAYFEADGYTYRYILSLKDGDVVEEYLHRRLPGRGAEATLFERAGSTITLGASLKSKRISTDIDAKMPFFSYLAINHNVESVDAAFDWFMHCSFLDYSRSAIEYRFTEMEGSKEKDRVIELLNNMDIDISNFRFERKDEDRIAGIYLSHKIDGKEYELELSEESNGTRKLLGLIPIILETLEDGRVLVSDELDAKLHPKLFKYLISLFTNSSTNPKGAQLLLTSHDTSTLKSSVFRRDEIWFAAKTEEGPSVLYSLADIKDIDNQRIRTQNAYDKQYLEGRYGADPYLKLMLS
ncbi:MAG: AAA family ATPase [Coriobacteriales bacterium]|jgi:AAA15 family ATPase/GTPase|nr:AAA family ATPase [Coriobacteriales bacterium]